MNPGTELGKYRIVRRVGRGGMADVYEAEDKELGRRVALKLLPPEFARDPERVARFMKEVRNSAALQHPNIIPIYDVGEGDGFHFYTMQLLEGGDLKERIKAGLSQPEALAILKQVASALGTAHAAGVVHRDVKPENVMFDGEGRAILTDLGIAKAASGGTRMTKTGMSIGTPHYMSPEQARGIGVDGRSDIYSLGVVSHEMLTGHVPFDAEESFAVGLMHINDPVPVLPPDLSGYQPMLSAMLGKEPQDRYPDCSALILDVDRVARGESPKGVAAPAGGAAGNVATQVVPQAHGAAPSKGGSLKAAMIGALAALLIAAGVFVFMDRGRLGVTQRGGAGAVASPASGPASPASRPGKSSLAKDVGSSTGGVHLTSEPSGAEVFLDGERKGRTPLQLNKVSAGAHSVELRLKEYEVERTTLNVRSGEVARRNVGLRYDQALLKSLTVMAEPANATIKILNIKPRYKPGIKLKPGRYKVQISKEGFDTKTLSVNISTVDVEMPVALDRSQYAMYVDARPSGAKISVSGLGRSFVQGMKLNKGKYTIKVEADGYVPVERDVRLEKDERFSVSLSKKKYHLHVYTNPQGATVRFVDGGMNYYGGMSVEPGTYSVEVSAKGYKSKIARLRVDDGDARHNVTLEKLGKRLVIKGVIDGCNLCDNSYSNSIEFYLDGRRLGSFYYKNDEHDSEMVFDDLVPPGKHEIKITGKYLKDYRRTINVTGDNRLVATVSVGTTPLSILALKMKWDLKVSYR